MELNDDMKTTRWSCRAFHCFSEEDHMGVLKIAACRHAGKSFERKMLRSALLRQDRLTSMWDY